MRLESFVTQLRSALLGLFLALWCVPASAAPPTPSRSLSEALTAFHQADYRRAATLSRMAGDRALGVEREGARYLEGLALVKAGDFEQATKPLRTAATSSDAFIAAQAGVTLGSAEIGLKKFDAAGYAYRRAAVTMTGAEALRAHSIAARCFDGAGLSVLAEEERAAAGEARTPPAPLAVAPETPPAAPVLGESQRAIPEPNLRVGPEDKPRVAHIAPVRYAIQIGAFSSLEKATAAAERQRARCAELHLEEPRVIAREGSDGTNLHVVQFGKFMNRGGASKALLGFPRSAYRIEVYLAGGDSSE